MPFHFPSDSLELSNPSSFRLSLFPLCSCHPLSYGAHPIHFTLSISPSLSYSSFAPLYTPAPSALYPFSLFTFYVFLYFPSFRSVITSAICIFPPLSTFPLLKTPETACEAQSQEAKQQGRRDASRNEIQTTWSIK